VTKVPIACTLTVDAAVDRVAEWKELLSTVVARVDHDRNHATLTILGTEALVAVTDLAERERVCCSFFQFSIELDGNETRLRIGVPFEAEPILNELLTLVPSHIRPAR
jgi:hypothetical protein